MCTLLKLLAGVLVLVDCAKDANDFLLCRERNGTGNLSIGSLCGLYDLLRRLVVEVVVIALKSDSDFSLCCHCLRLLNNWRALLFSFNASGCFIVSLLKNRKTIFPGLLKADAITAASSEGARETHPVRQSDLFRPVLKSDILRRNSPSQRTATFCIIAYQLIVFRAYLPHFPQSCLIIIPHKALYCKGFRNIFSKTFVMKIDPLYMDILVKMRTR